MAKHRIKIGDIAREVNARRFASHVDGQRYWFLVHESTTSRGQLVVTHQVSGMKVCDVAYMQRMASIGDDVGAAKMALATLIEKHGAPRIKVILDSAPKL